MAGVTSLLKSAQATQKKIASQEDAQIAFEWENSAQTYEDFQVYSKYLEDRQRKSSDPSQQLTYANKIRTANRSYVSNELQRQQMDIMEGRASTKDKMAAVQSLFYQAQQNGDLNLAQNLLSQWDGLSIKLQNETDAALKSYAAAGGKAFNALSKKLTKGYDDVTLPDGTTVTPLAAIARDLETTGGSQATWKAAQDTLEALQSVIVDQYKNATSQEEIDKLEEKYGVGLQDIQKELTFSVGGKKLTAQEVVNAAANETYNNPIYSLQAVRNEATGQNEFKLKENNVASQDYIRQLDEQGNEFYAPISTRTDQNSLFFGGSDQGRGLGTQITDTGQVIGGELGKTGTGQVNAGEAKVRRDDSQTIGNRLKELGIVATQNGTTLKIKLPGESVEREATVQPDGSIRYFADDGQMVEMGLVDRNLGSDIAPQIFKKGEQRVVAPDEISDFGTTSAFGGISSRSSAQGNRYTQSILGQVQPTATQPLTGPIRTGNDFSGFGAPLTSNLLQGAQFTRNQIVQEQQRQQMLQSQQEAATQLQASQTFNLNQTPIQQFASNGVLKRQLQVTPTKPAARVYVAPPAPTPTITGVSNYQPTQGAKVVVR